MQEPDDEDAESHRVDDLELASHLAPRLSVTARNAATQAATRLVPG